MDAVELTERQHSVLQFIEAQIKKNGYPPTIREIGRHLGIKSTNGVNDHLNALQRKGFVKRQDHKSRTLAVVKRSTAEARGGDAPKLVPVELDDDLVDVPLLGRVAAGVPILAEENREDTVRVSSFFLGRGYKQEKIFALKVVGESMIDDGIFDGDLIAVHRTPVAENGQIVVARIDGELTVKRFQRDSRRISLLPRNPDYAPIVIAPDADFAIEGLYCGLVRGA